MSIKMESNNIPLSKSLKPSGSPAILDEYEQTLAHLVRMASTQGWKDYAWHRAKELDAHPTKLWRGIADDLVKIMKEKNAKTEE
jgi:hypothetical protein